MERVISCPICYDLDACFEDIQPDFKSYMCFNCGFMSDSRYETDSLRLIENLKSSPKLQNSTNHIVNIQSKINIRKSHKPPKF